MAKLSPRQWDIVAVNNSDIAGISLQENITKPSDVNNFERTEMSQIAQWLVEMSYPTAGGTANALTLTPTAALAALTANQAYTFNAASANSTAATLAVSGLTAKAIRKIVGGTDVALAANDIQANGRYTVVYDTAANGAAGAWILTSPTTNLTDLGAVAKAGDTMTGQLRNTKAPALPTSGATDFAYLADASFGGGYSLKDGTAYYGLWANSGDWLFGNGTSAGLVERLRIKSGGDLALVNHLDISAAGAGQIVFPAAQNASAGVNTLDDYEEGTWTPTAVSGVGTITSYTSSGNYTKVGRQIVATMILTITNNGTGSGSLTIGGFPFASVGAVGGCMRETVTSGSLCGFGMPTGSTFLNLFTYNNAYPAATNSLFQGAFAYNTT